VVDAGDQRIAHEACGKSALREIPHCTWAPRNHRRLVPKHRT
jgi:hypothetical protein